MAVMTYREALRETLREEMRRDEAVFCLGEDIGAFGGALLFMFSEALGVAIRSNPPPGAGGPLHFEQDSGRDRDESFDHFGDG